MAAREGQFYYDEKGGTIGENQVAGVRIEYKGQTRDGFNVHHFSFHRDGNHISYDTVKINNEYHYIRGSGHTRYHSSGQIVRWDPGNRRDWQDALRMFSYQLIK